MPVRDPPPVPGGSLPPFSLAGPIARSGFVPFGDARPTSWSGRTTCRRVGGRRRVRSRRSRVRSRPRFGAVSRDTSESRCPSWCRIRPGRLQLRQRSPTSAAQLERWAAASLDPAGRRRPRDDQRGRVDLGEAGMVARTAGSAQSHRPSARRAVSAAARGHSRRLRRARIHSRRARLPDRRLLASDRKARERQAGVRGQGHEGIQLTHPARGRPPHRARSLSLRFRHAQTSSCPHRPNGLPR